MSTFSKLYEYFKPKHYKLFINLEREKRLFDGQVTIEGTVVSGDTIKLHAKDININRVIVNNEEAKFSKHENDELHIDQKTNQPKNKIITIDFSGKITDSMHGLYPCYFDVDGKKQELLATQFESHHAREVFPCIDEPSAKATFDLTLSTEENITVLGNMPIKSQKNKNNKTITEFETTPKMSSYLLAWVCGDLQKISTKTKNNVDISVFSTKAHSVKSLEFALEISKKCIEFYEDFFQTKYPLPKIDHVALPDFSSGAMENWGLITYRESAMIASDQSTFTDKCYIASVIAHELSHQWFGNLVTMKWWDDLWLNESFANMMEYLSLDKIYPDWKMWYMFNSHEGRLAFARDSLEGVQPVYLPVKHPDEISSIFDGAIVYAKGGRLLRMVQHFFGEEKFKKGLRSYFKKYAYQNTAGDDLWDCLSEESVFDIKEMMHTWLSKPGYPVVVIEDIENGYKLTQKRFLIEDNQSDKSIWTIPLNSTNKNHPEIMDTKDIILPESKPFRLNDNNSAHFITKYSPQLFKSILSDIKNGNLDDGSCFQILNEQTLLAEAGYVKFSDLMDLIKVLKNNRNPEVWASISFAIGKIRATIDSDDKLMNKLRQYVNEICKDAYKELGWDKKPEENDRVSEIRHTILSLMTFAKNDDAINEAKKRFNNTKIDNMDPNNRQIILSSVIRNFDKDNIIAKQLLYKYPKTVDAAIRSDLESALTDVKNEDIIEEILSSIKNPKIIRPQDVFLFYAFLIRSRYAKKQTWSWLKNNWDFIEKSFSGDKCCDYFPRYSANAMKTNAELKDYKEFFNPLKSDPSLTRVIEIGEKEIAGKIKQIERDFKDIEKYLNSL